MLKSRRLIAITQVLLILPACLFMTSLVVRGLGPMQSESVQVAHQIVMWYAARMWTLWVLLIALPLAVLITGCVALLFNLNDASDLRQAARHPPFTLRAHFAALFIAAATLTAVAILAVVIVHMLMN
jgi:hypothetical protein